MSDIETNPTPQFQVGDRIVFEWMPHAVKTIVAVTPNGTLFIKDSAGLSQVKRWEWCNVRKVSTPSE